MLKGTRLPLIKVTLQELKELLSLLKTIISFFRLWD
jgi:hypothetical protein